MCVCESTPAVRVVLERGHTLFAKKSAQQNACTFSQVAPSLHEYTNVYRYRPLPRISALLHVAMTAQMQNIAFFPSDAQNKRQSPPGETTVWARIRAPRGTLFYPSRCLAASHKKKERKTLATLPRTLTYQLRPQCVSQLTHAKKNTCSAAHMSCTALVSK